MRQFSRRPHFTAGKTAHKLLLETTLTEEDNFVIIPIQEEIMEIIVDPILNNTIRTPIQEEIIGNNSRSYTYFNT